MLDDPLRVVVVVGVVPHQLVGQQVGFLFELVDDFVPAHPHLGVVVVVRDGNDVGRVDLAHDHAVALAHVAAEAVEVVVAADMEAGGARAVGVFVDHVARHLQNLPDAVVELTGVQILVVGAHLLVGEEVAVVGERQAAVLDELDQTADGAEARVGHDLGEESHERCDRQLRSRHLQDALNDRPVLGQRLAVEVQDVVFEFGLAVRGGHVLGDGFGRLHGQDQLVPVAGA